MITDSTYSQTRRRHEQVLSAATRRPFDSSDRHASAANDAADKTTARAGITLAHAGGESDGLISRRSPLTHGDRCYRTADTLPIIPARDGSESNYIQSQLSTVVALHVLFCIVYTNLNFIIPHVIFRFPYVEPFNHDDLPNKGILTFLRHFPISPQNRGVRRSIQ